MQRILKNIIIPVSQEIFIKDPISSVLGKRVLKESLAIIEAKGIEAFNFNPDYVIGFLRPDKVRGDACPVFTGSVAIARKSDCLEILA